MAKKIVAKKESSVKKDSLKKDSHIWKVIAVIFILVFVLVVIGGLMQVYRFRASFKQATSAQMDTAKNAALNDLSSKGENITGYTVRVSDVLRPVPSDVASNGTLEVSISNESARYLYIVDADTGNILVYSNTIFYDGANHSSDGEREMQYGPMFR